MIFDASPASSFAALLTHLVPFFALFALPLLALGAFVAFFIYKDFLFATDTTNPDDVIKQTIADHEAMLAAVEEQRVEQAASVKSATILKLEGLLAGYADDGMPEDMKSTANAILQLDAENEKAKAAIASLG